MRQLPNRLCHYLEQTSEVSARERAKLIALNRAS
jgi:hypothetical protein